MAFPAFMKKMMPDTVVAQPGGEGPAGGWTSSGVAVQLTNCYISVKNRSVRDSKGETVVSSAKVTTSSVNNLNTHEYRYTLPSDGRFDPYSLIEAIGVKNVSDGEDPHHEVIFLP